MSYRVILESAGGEIRVIRKTRVDMIAPAMPVDVDQKGPGVYAEIRDDTDRTIYRTSISAQLAPTIEAFDADGAVQRVDAGDRKRVIVLVIPDSPEAHSLAVVRHGGEGAPASSARFRAEATSSEEELLRVPLSGGDTFQ